MYTHKCNKCSSLLWHSAIVFIVNKEKPCVAQSGHVGLEEISLRFFLQTNQIYSSWLVSKTHRCSTNHKTFSSINNFKSSGYRLTQAKLDEYQLLFWMGWNRRICTKKFRVFFYPLTSAGNNTLHIDGTYMLKQIFCYYSSTCFTSESKSN